MSLATARLMSAYSSSFGSLTLEPSFFSPMTLGVHRMTRAPASWDALDHVLQAGLVLLLRRALRRVLFAVPDVVDADVDDHDGRLLRQHVLVQAGLQVGHLVAADAGADDFEVEVLVLLVEFIPDERDDSPWGRRRPG